MSVELQDLINFHLTGQRRATAPDLSETRFCPALLAPYRNLSELRYDFPLVLLDDEDSPAFADTLTGIINRLLRDIAPQGNAGEQLRRHILRLESRIRELVENGAQGSLGELWQAAEKSLKAEVGKAEREPLGDSLNTARFALRSSGVVVSCDDRLPERALAHAWRRHEHRRARGTLARLSALAIRLRNMLRVDDLKTSNSRTPSELKKTVGKHFKDAFDFELMADVLGDSTPRNHLPAERRARIREVLGMLEKQRFFGEDAYRFLFDSLPTALKAYTDRLPEMAEVVKAMSIAELECDNAYSPEKHDNYFDRFGPDALAPEDLALFPTYLVTLHEDDCSTLDTAKLMEIVSCDLPIKVLLQVSDALGTRKPSNLELHAGSYVQQLAHTLMAPGSAFVLQTTAAYLGRHQDQIAQGLEYEGAAIFSVFVPSANDEQCLPDYLVAAAALEARVFPAFSYDPAKGAGLIDRFDIRHNPEFGSDWPRRELRYEDGELQSVRENIAFTPADFALTCIELSKHFTLASGDFDAGKLVPVADFLALPAGEAFDKVPFVVAVDEDNRLVRLVIDEYLVRRVRRSLERWHALQELGGEHNSYAAAARAKAQAEIPVADAAPVPEARKEPEADELEAEAEAEVPSDEPAGDASVDDGEPYIETPRCTTCDECTNRNDRMFAYDDNKQAYIKDPDAGTYRDLVEAAELCQVSIIHPGLPRNPAESGLAELIERAKPFQAGPD